MKKRLSHFETASFCFQSWNSKHFDNFNVLTDFVLDNSRKLIYKIIRIFSALVWAINGLYCKILAFVPRHEEIVLSILVTPLNLNLTKIIGFLELGMVLWILSGLWKKINLWTQISIILLMNIIEACLVPQLLLWGKFNFIFAIMFCALLYWNEAKLNPQHA